MARPPATRRNPPLPALTHNLADEAGGDGRVALRRPTPSDPSDKFDDPKLPGEIEVTIDLKKVSCGTEINIVQAGLPDVIPVEACYLGWQESLILLGKLVEAEVGD